MFVGLSIERLKSFLEVANAGGFAKAAKGNPVRQSQLNRQVSALEGALAGRKLVERRGRGIVLTAAGERLATVVREMMVGFHDVARGEGVEPLRFTLGAGDSLLQWWVVPRIGAIAKPMPRAVPSLVSLSSVDVVTRLLDGRLDFGLVRAAEVPRELRSKPLIALEYALYVPTKLRAKVPSDDVAALLRAIPLAIQSSEPELNERILATARKVGATQPALQCETFPQACAAVRSGRYAALLPTIVESELRAREVVEVTLPGLGRFDAKLHLAWHVRTTRRSASFARLAGELEQCLRSDEE